MALLKIRIDNNAKTKILRCEKLVVKIGKFKMRDVVKKEPCIVKISTEIAKKTSGKNIKRLF